MKYLFAPILILIVLGSCRKPESYPETPAITFQSFTKSVSTDLLGNKILRGKLSFYLIDGNGDIGFNEEDTIAPWSPGTEYFNNLHIIGYRLENGSYVSDTNLNLSYRTPYIEPRGQNKTRKCTILIDIDYNYINGNQLPYDSIKYSFYLYDRALNKSNTASTGLITLP